MRVPWRLPDASVVESSAKTVISEPADIGFKVRIATSDEDGSRVEVATILIGNPFAFAPAAVSRTLKTTVSD